MCPRKQKKTATAEKAKGARKWETCFFEPMKIQDRTISARTTLTRRVGKGMGRRKGRGWKIE